MTTAIELEEEEEDDEIPMTRAEMEKKFDELRTMLITHLTRANEIGVRLSKTTTSRDRGAAFRRALRRILWNVEKETQDQYRWRKSLEAVAKVSKEAYDIAWSPSSHGLSILRLERQVGVLCMTLEHCLERIDRRSSATLATMRRERRVAWPTEEVLTMLEKCLEN